MCRGEGEKRVECNSRLVSGRIEIPTPDGPNPQRKESNKVLAWYIHFAAVAGEGMFLGD